MSTAIEQRRTWRDYKVDWPEGTAGPWNVSRFTLSEADIAANFRILLSGRSTEPGTYTQLTRNGTIVMTDTRAEIRDMMEPIWAASWARRYIINGLGLGILPRGLLLNPEVERIDVVEKDADVISLIAPHFDDSRLVVHHGDAFTFRFPPNTTWDYAWHDIWDNICGDNLPEMARLHRRYGRRVQEQKSWARALCERGFR